MEERERRRQELMNELAKRFISSSEAMRLIARRICEAAKVHNANRRRLDEASRPLRNCVEADAGPLPFTYREFVEFSSADEFIRFKEFPPITAEEISAIDWDDLSKKLTE